MALIPCRPSMPPPTGISTRAWVRSASSTNSSTGGSPPASFPLRIVRGEQPGEGGHDGRLRPADRRKLLEVLPAAAEGVVEVHEILGRGLLGHDVLVLDVV